VLCAERVTGRLLRFALAPLSPRALKQAELDGLVHDAHDADAAERGRTGSPRITQQFRRQGRRAGRHQVARCMHRQRLWAKGARKYNAMTNSNRGLPVAQNLLQQSFYADRPSQTWAGDIISIAMDEGWL
jgi:putative transposase